MSRTYILILFLLLQGVLYAQPKMTVQVDEKVIALNDYLHIQYTIENAEKINRFIPPDFRGFKVIQGPDYTSGWTLVNGNMKEYTSISFVLVPARKGKWVIKPASANVDNASLQSSSVTIEVRDQPAAPPVQPDNMAGNQPLNDMILKEGESVSQKIKNNLFVKLDINRHTVYVGEPITATYKLYTRLNSESKVTRRPSFSGFSVFDMADPESEQATFEKLNGKEFNVYLLRKVQLYPLQEGKYELEEIQVDNNVSFIRSSFARDENTLNGLLRAFGEEALGPAAWIKEQVTLSSIPQTVTVKPLPPDQQPADFKGAVGKFSLRAVVNETQVSVGDLVNLTMIIEGSGNLPVLGSPEVNWPAGIETFEPELKEEFNKSVSPISGRKIITIPFTPAASGKLIIPAIHMSAFDPAQGKYIQLSTDSISLMVVGATVQKSKTIPPKPGYVQKESSRDSLPSNAVIFISIGLLLAIIGFFIWRKSREEKGEKDLAKSRTILPEKPAEPAVQQLSLFPHIYQLDEAEKFLLEGNPKAFYKETEQTIVSVLKERFDLERNAGREKIAGRLSEKNMPDETIRSLIAILDDCQMAIYSPFIVEEKMREDYEKAVIILKKLQENDHV